MSKNNNSNSDVSDTESEGKGDFFTIQIKQILERYPDIDKKCIFKLLVKKCKHYYDQSVAMQNDPLWEKVVIEAESYKDEQDEVNVSESASFEHGMKHFKPIIMEMISDLMNEEKEEETSQDVDDDDDDDDENSVHANANNEAINNQKGIGYGRYRRFPRNIF